VRKSLVITVVVWLATSSALCQTAQERPASKRSARPATANNFAERQRFVRTRGSGLVVGARKKNLLLRGVVFFPSGLVSAEEKDYEDVARLNMNTVRVILQYKFFYEPSAPNSYKESAWKWLDSHVALARKHRLYLVLQMLDVEGAQFVPIKGVPFNYRIWEDRQLQDRFVRLWRVIAQRYKNETQIVGYSLFCEPVLSGTVEQWSKLANRTIKEIREVDGNHIVFVERMYGENQIRREVSGIDFPPERAFFLVNDRNVVYEFYFFERDEYTHQFAPWRADVQTSVHYPDQTMKIIYKEQAGLGQRTFSLDKDYLQFYLRRQTEFGKKHNVPMFVWGFGLLRNCFAEDKGGATWLRDVTELFNAERLNWTFLAYRDEDFIGVNDSLAVRQILAKAVNGKRMSRSF
jgi:hypothetical protein